MHLHHPHVVVGIGLGILGDVSENAQDAGVLVVETEVVAVLHVADATEVEGQFPVAAISPDLAPDIAGNVGASAGLFGIGE